MEAIGIDHIIGMVRGDIPIAAGFLMVSAITPMADMVITTTGIRTIPAVSAVTSCPVCLIVTLGMCFMSNVSLQ
jgi:hypothetical protein